MTEVCRVGSVGGGWGRSCNHQIFERGTWRDRPKDFSRFVINTLSRYLGWGIVSDGDHSEKTVWQPRIILFSRSDCWRCRRLCLDLIVGGAEGCGFWRHKFGLGWNVYVNWSTGGVNRRVASSNRTPGGIPRSVWWVLGNPTQPKTDCIDLLSSVWIFCNWVCGWMYPRHCVACTNTLDFHKSPIVFGEVLAWPKVEWWELWISRLDLRSRNNPCNLPFTFWMLSSIWVCRVHMDRSLSIGTPRYLNESTTLSIAVFWGWSWGRKWNVMNQVWLDSLWAGCRCVLKVIILVLSMLISILLFSHHTWQVLIMDCSSHGDLLTSTRSST
jgi:hypothetical protein